MTFKDQTFLDERVDVTGHTFLGCKFDGCIVHYDKSIPVYTHIEGCQFEGCALSGDAYASVFMNLRL